MSGDDANVQNSTGNEELDNLRFLIKNEHERCVFDHLVAWKIISIPQALSVASKFQTDDNVIFLDLLEEGGFITDLQRKSIQLGEYLIATNKVSARRFFRALRNEIRTEQRAAEFLSY